MPLFQQTQRSINKYMFKKIGIHSPTWHSTVWHYTNDGKMNISITLLVENCEGTLLCDDEGLFERNCPQVRDRYQNWHQIVGSRNNPRTRNYPLNQGDSGNDPKLYGWFGQHKSLLFLQTSPKLKTRHGDWRNKEFRARAANNYFCFSICLDYMVWY